jgi:hypothetical protein
MDLHKDVGVLLLHGVPGDDPLDPCDQFKTLKKNLQLQSLIPEENIICPPWEEGVPNIFRALKKGLLGKEGADSLNQYLRARSEIQRWIIVGYSGGGWIFNHWLFCAAREVLQGKEAREDRLDRIIIAFTIGAPYRNTVSKCWFGGQLRQGFDLWELGKQIQSVDYCKLTEPIEAWRLNPEWELDTENLGADVIAHALKGRYCTVWSYADHTVWPENAKFPEKLEGLVHQLPLDDKEQQDQRIEELINLRPHELQDLASQGKIDQSLLERVNWTIGRHGHLCNLPEVSSFIRRHLVKALESTRI